MTMITHDKLHVTVALCYCLQGDATVS